MERIEIDEEKRTQVELPPLHTDREQSRGTATTTHRQLGSSSQPKPKPKLKPRQQDSLLTVAASGTTYYKSV